MAVAQYRPLESQSGVDWLHEPTFQMCWDRGRLFSDFQYEAWSRIPEVNLEAISNRTESKARQKMAEYSIPRFYADWREMIDREQADFIDIITPSQTHSEICEYAAKRGVAIIC